MEAANIVQIEVYKGSCGPCRARGLCLAAGLSDVELQHVEAIVQRGRPLSRGETLYRQGDALDALYAVRSGTVKVVTCTPDGHEQIVRFCLPGEIIGLDGLELDRYTCTAIALDTVSVCRVPLDRLENLADRVPALYRRLLRLVSREVAADHSRQILLGQRGAEERLAAFLLSLSEEYRRRGFSAREFNLSMSRQDIANYLALAVETVSRLFTAFQASGLINVDRRRVTLLARERLQALVQRVPAVTPPRLRSSGVRTQCEA